MNKLNHIFYCLFIVSLIVPAQSHGALFSSLQNRTIGYLKNEYTLLKRNMGVVNKLAHRESLSEQDRHDLNSAGKRALIAGGILLAVIIGVKLSGQMRNTTLEMQPLDAGVDEEPALRKPVIGNKRKSEIPPVVNVPHGEMPPQPQEEDKPLDLTSSSLNPAIQPAPLEIPIEMSGSSTDISKLPAPIIEDNLPLLPVPQREQEVIEVGAPPAPPLPSIQPQSKPVQFKQPLPKPVQKQEIDPMAVIKAKAEEMKRKREQKQLSSSAIKVTVKPAKVDKSPFSSLQAQSMLNRAQQKEKEKTSKEEETEEEIKKFVDLGSSTKEEKTTSSQSTSQPLPISKVTVPPVPAKKATVPPAKATLPSVTQTQRRLTGSAIQGITDIRPAMFGTGSELEESDYGPASDID